MPVIELTTRIAAPMERVFDLSRSIDLHRQTASLTGEQAVAGVVSGLIGMGQDVTWRARHFGIWQSLTVRITVFQRPSHFADEMVRGAFKSMEHHHFFEAASDGTVMRDVFSFRSPLGILGRIADSVFLERYMRNFLIGRNQIIKSTAESEAWRQFC
jgi:ligand-binding SRPBCC domain-containing protein